MDRSTSPAVAEPIADSLIVASGNLDMPPQGPNFVLADMSAALHQVQPSTSANVFASDADQLVFVLPVVRTVDDQASWADGIENDPLEGVSDETNSLPSIQTSSQNLTRLHFQALISPE